MIALEEVPGEDVVHYGIAEPRGGAAEVFELADLVEKPAVGEVPSNLAVAARYVFSPRIFDCLERTPPGKGDEIQLTDAIRMLIQQGGKVLGVRLSPGQTRFDIGNFESYFRGVRRVRPGRPAVRRGAAGARRRELLGAPEREDRPCC